VSLRVGQTVASRYQVLAPLGKGGMGTVVRARDAASGHDVALKVLEPDWAQRAEMRERFRLELVLAQKVHHRNVCRVLDCGEDGRRRYVVTELIDGLDLKRLLVRSGGLAPEHAFEGAVQVARGLQAIHDAGIVHRDVKSPNIMVDRDGRFRLLDFDLAEHVERAARGGRDHVYGTPEYMSPEQARGRSVGFPSDVYSLGVVVFELFTGEVPFRGETTEATVRKHLEEPPPLAGPRAALPPPLVPVLRKCLEKYPDRRYPRARSVVEALRLSRTMLDLGEAPSAASAAPQGVSALLGALNPLDATVRVEQRAARARWERRSREAMARLVAALTQDPA
jgi:serine/threonine-protein kinase